MIAQTAVQTSVPTAVQAAAKKSPLILGTVVGASEQADTLAFIKGGFSTHFGSSAKLEPPRLLAMRDQTGTLVGGLGLRSAADGFFSQHYLDVPVEVLLSEERGSPVAPESIVEVVHLAVLGPEYVSPLLDRLALLLTDEGYRYALCTVTRCLRRLFIRRGWAVTRLGDARPDVLGDAATQWGSYYDQQPVVIAGDLDSARRIAMTRKATTF